MRIDLAATYRVVALLTACGTAITTAEFAFHWREYRADGLYSWALARERRVLVRNPSLLRAVSPLLDVPGFWAVLALRLLASLTIIVATTAFRTLPGAAVVVLFLTTLAMTFRHAYGLDGSDQMTSILIVALMLHCFAPENRIVALIAIWFLALQSCLAYFTSGVAKLASRGWREGTAVFQVLNTASFGRRGVARLLANVPWAARLLSWSVIAFESAFPLAVVTGRHGALLFLAGGILMHVGIAYCMGLGSFVWAFVATYPAVFYVADTVR
jgi:hypothetical protein